MSARRSHLQAPGLGLLAGLVAVSCYTGPVNERPTVRIVPLGSFYRGSPVTYRAIPDDKEGRPPTIEWTTTNVPCPTPLEVQNPENWPKPPMHVWKVQDAGEGFALLADVTKADFCVWARVKDRHGAVAIDALDGEPMNHPPMAKLKRTPASEAVPLRTLLTLTTGTSTDLDADDLNAVGWAIDAAPVPPKTLSFAACPVADLADPTGKDTKCFIPEAAGEYTFSTRVRDGIDEVVVMSSVVVQEGHAPVAKLELKSPAVADTYPLGTTFHISGAASFDEDSDVIDPSWDYKAFGDSVPTSAAKLGPCEGTMSPFEHCFRADAKGIYRVSMKVSEVDGGGMSNAEMLLEVRGDEPPCLRVTDPPMNPPLVGGELNAEAPYKVFEVLRVEDDLDPYPPDPARAHEKPSFRWSVGTGTGTDFQPAECCEFASFRLPTDGYRYGDEVSVRLDVFDRVTSVSQQQACLTSTCPTCPQRVEWKVRFIR